MQDRFKFRAIRLDNNKFYYGSYLYLHNAPQYDCYGNKKGTLKDVHYIIDENDINYAINPDTLCQCTGLKDKKGKLIYEGDIVKDGNNFILEVTYRQDKGAFYLENDRIAGAISELKYSTNTMEIIGNIYETPKLLSQRNV